MSIIHQCDRCRMQVSGDEAQEHWKYINATSPGYNCAAVGYSCLAELCAGCLLEFETWLKVRK